MLKMLNIDRQKMSEFLPIFDIVSDSPFENRNKMLR